MRDLSKQKFQTQTANSKFVKPFGAVVIVVILIVAISKFIDKGSSMNSGGLVLRDAPHDLKPVPLDSKLINAAQGGTELSTQTAFLKDVKYGGEASGKATRSFGGGEYILSVDATMPDPKTTDYEVWLVGESGVVPIDFMKGSKTRWSLSLRDKDKFSSYRGIWITLERTKDNKPEEHVLEGSF